MLHTICMGTKMLQTCLTVTTWMIDCHITLSVGFTRQESWSGLSCPPLGDLPDPEINSDLLHWQADSLPLVPPEQPYTCHKGSPHTICDSTNIICFE